MWENTDRSITAISKFDDISRSVIHSRVALLNEALQRELESSPRNELKNPAVYFEDLTPARPSVELEVEDDNDAKRNDTIRRLEEMVHISSLGNIH